VQAAFTVITLVAVVIISQSFYLGLVWQVRPQAILAAHAQVGARHLADANLLLLLTRVCLPAGGQICDAGVLRSAQKHRVGAAVVCSACCRKHWSCR